MQNAAKFKRIKVTARDVIKPMAALLSLNIIVLTVWTVVDPLHSEIEVLNTDAFGRPTETQGKIQARLCIVLHIHPLVLSHLSCISSSALH